MQAQTNIIKSMQKVIVTLLLIVIFLSSCLGVTIIFFSAAWLHTYNAFTDKTLIAEIEVKPIESDPRGLEKFEVSYKQYSGESGLTKLIFPNRESSDNVDVNQSYTMFGDTVFIEAHIVKLPDALTLLNFEAVYKITGIEGDYVNDKDKARQLNGSERSIYELNDGVDSTWKWIKENEGRISFVVDTAFVSKQGKDVGNNTQKWGVYITEEGLMIDRIE